ncbi:MAG: TonB-dependent receptor plug domain-containing protein [Opitutus sp.]
MNLQNTQAPRPPAGRRRTSAAALTLFLTTLGFSQTAPSDTRPDNERDEAVVLSPFVVDASQDKGYRATKTLAGSRISTDLKDVAASVTVVTKEFLTDINAVGINDILSYTANTEGTRDFTATVPTLGRPSDDVAANPQGANRLRGLFSADITRDYFYTIGSQVGFDTYNLDQVTINRGPNSVLAGLGSPAGIINYSPMLAGLTRSSNEVTYRFGSFSDQRATFNSNIVAKKDALAFRVAGAWSDQGFKQKPAWNEDERIYTTVTYKPWSKTTIRAGYEHVKVNSNRPNSLTPEDDISQWVALGKPSYDRNSATPVSPFLWRDGNVPTVFYSKNGTIDSAINTNTGYYFNQQNLGNAGIWQPIRMNSNKYLQLDEVNTSPSTGNQKLETKSISLDQEIAPGLNGNISYINEKIDGSYLNLFRPEYANYAIDVNMRTPWGASNPHYGETYMQFRGLDNKQTDHNTNRVARATLTYDLDLTKHNKWFGRYRATGFVEDRRTETEHVQYTAKRSDIAAYLQETGVRYYLGGSATTQATTVPRQPGLFSKVPDIYFDSVSGTFKQDTLTNFYALKSDNKSLTKLASSAVVLQGYLWDDRIVGMFGLRRDIDKAGFASSVEGGQTDPATGLIPPAPPYGDLAKVAKQTKTYGVVVHPLKWLSLHYNHAENFIPNAGSIDLTGKSTPSPTGLGKDYGFSVSLLDDKLNAKLNWFELTAGNGNAGNPANFPLAQWNMTFMDLVVGPELAKLAGVPYKQGVAAGIIVGDPRIAYTADNVSKGLELELTYNVTKNWRIMASVAKQEAKQTNIAPALTTFVEERLAYWKSVPGLWTGQRTQNNPWGLTQTGQEHFNQFLLGSYIGYKSVDGQPSTQLRKWHASVLSNYEFTDGPLKNFNIGGGARYLEKAVIGNPAILDATGTVTALDLAHPYYSGGYIAVDAWVGYRRKILHDRYVLGFQLNGRDLEQSGGFRPIAANSDGAHSVYRIVQPRTFYLTTKLEF